MIFLRTWTPDICLYHADCMDGFGAAWAVWKRWGDAVEYIPASYGGVLPNVAGRHVLMVDFSYKKPQLEALAASAATIVILDHHETAASELAGFNSIVGARVSNVGRCFARVVGPNQNVLVEFDMERSGAPMAWSFCHDEPVPDLLRYIEDRDLWRFVLPHSKEINAYLASFDQDFHEWDVMRSELDHGDVHIGGAAILRQRSKDIDALLSASLRFMTIGGHRVPVANVPFMWASDAGNTLAEGNPFAATYFDRRDGQRAFSLRSDSFWAERGGGRGGVRGRRPRARRRFSDAGRLGG